MIELVSVELTNFRSVSHGEFAPLGLGQGMTAINGSNGMGKCLPGYVRVFDGETGEAMPLEQFVRDQRKSIVGYSGGKVAVVPVNDWMVLGSKSIVTVKLVNGTSLDAAETHPILTDKGCVRAADLKPGDWVAEPRTMPTVGAPRLTVDEALIIGLLLGDGHFGRSGVSLTAAEPAVRDVFRTSLERVFPGLTISTTDARGWQHEVGGMLTGEPRADAVRALAMRFDALGIDLRPYLPEGTPVEMVRRGTRGFTWETLTAIEEDYAVDLSVEKTQLCGRRIALEWARELGLLGTRSNTKFVPPSAMLLPAEHTLAMLAGLWMADGWFHGKKSGAVAAAYATDSLRLAMDVRTLLKRVNIASSLQTQVRDGKAHYRVNASVQDITKFAEMPLVGPKADARDEVIKVVTGRRAARGMDMIPESFNIHLATKSASGRYRSAKQLARHAMSREVYRDFGGPTEIVDADIMWTQVVAVEETGRVESCFDITVDTAEHLYVAENLIVHNSSIVHGLVWACYGVTPDGVPVRALRRQGSDGEVSVVATFRHDGQTITVSRALRGRNDTTIAAIAVDGVEQTNVSAKTAALWMQNRLGLDAEAFLTAFVVRQKELESLVRARPADRRKTIERLAGIERMSAALDLARQEARTTQRVLEALPAADDPGVAATAVEHATRVFEAAVDAAQRAEEFLTTARAAANETAAAERDAQQLFHAAEQARTRVDLADADHRAAGAALTQLEALTAGADDLAHAQSAAAAAEEAREDAETVLTAARTAATAVTDATRRRDDAVAAASAATERALQARNAFDRAVEELSDAQEELENVDDLADSILELEGRLNVVGEQRGIAQAEWKQLDKAIKDLATSPDAAHCPTCAQALADPDAVLAEKQAALATVAARGTELSEEYTSLTVELTTLRAARTEAAVAAERLAGLARAVDAARPHMEQARQDVDQATIAVENAAATLVEVTRTAETATSAATEIDLDALRRDERAAQEALRRAETAARAANDLAAARERALEADATLQQARQDAYDAQTATTGLNPHDLRAATTAATATLATAETEHGEARTLHVIAQRDLQSTQEALVRAQQAAQARRDALSAVERATATASSLEEFRRDRLARLAPELSEVASDFVTRMTDGRYTAVELDEDFTPILTDVTGAQRPVAWLSGGEESAVALALRIAIGEVLAGQRGGLLVLDECLTAQDATRRQATMAAIRSLPRQVITINHVSEATDMVDLVAQLVDDGDGASTITTYTPDHAVTANLSDALVDA